MVKARKFEEEINKIKVFCKKDFKIEKKYSVEETTFKSGGVYILSLSDLSKHFISYNNDLHFYISIEQIYEYFESLLSRRKRII